MTSPYERCVPYFLLVIAIFATYGNIFDNAFLYDDLFLIQLNSYLVDWGHIGDILVGTTTSGAHLPEGFYRPLQILLYLIIYQFDLYQSDSYSPRLFHALNLLLHIANACLVYKIGVNFKFNRWGAFLAALVWGVHTLNSEAVNYISAVSEPLYSFFVLLATAILAPDFSQKNIYKIIPLFVFGLMSKEAMSVFPLLVVVCIFLTDTARFSFKTYLKSAPLWMISFAYMAWRLQAKGFSGPETFANNLSVPEMSLSKIYIESISARIFTCLAALPDYLSLILWPKNLHFDRDFMLYNYSVADAILISPIMIGVGIVLLSSVLIARSAAGKEHNLALSWSLLWFGAAFAPDSGILIPVNSLFLEHWMYLPTAGLFLGVAETLSVALQRHHRQAQVVLVLGLVISTFLAIGTYERNSDWHDPESFFNKVVANGIPSARAHNTFALFHLLTGDNEKAIYNYQKGIQISDTSAEARQNLAAALYRLPDRDQHTTEIIDNLTRALELNPYQTETARSLSKIYEKIGDKEKAALYREKISGNY